MSKELGIVKTINSTIPNPKKDVENSDSSCYLFVIKKEIKMMMTKSLPLKQINLLVQNKSLTKYKFIGLSLIEILLGLLIFTILLSYSFNISNSLIQNWHDKTVINLIYNFLENARENAVLNNNVIKIKLSDNTFNLLESNKKSNKLEIPKFYLSKYQITYKSFNKNNNIIFLTNNLDKNNYSNGTLYIKNISSNKTHKIVINRSGRLIYKS